MKSSQYMMNSSWKDGIQSIHDWWIVSRSWKNTVYDEVTIYIKSTCWICSFLNTFFSWLIFTVTCNSRMEEKNLFLSNWTWTFQIFKCHQLIAYTRVFYCFQKCWNFYLLFDFVNYHTPLLCAEVRGCLQEMRVIDKYLSSVLRIQQAFNKASLSLQQIIIISGNKSYNFWQWWHVLFVLWTEHIIPNDNRRAHHQEPKMTSLRHKASPYRP